MSFSVSPSLQSIRMPLQLHPESLSKKQSAEEKKQNEAQTPSVLYSKPSTPAWSCIPGISLLIEALNPNLKNAAKSLSSARACLGLLRHQGLHKNSSLDRGAQLPRTKPHPHTLRLQKPKPQNSQKGCKLEEKTLNACVTSVAHEQEQQRTLSFFSESHGGC